MPKLNDEDLADLLLYLKWVAQFDDVDLYVCPECGNKEWWALKKPFTLVIRCKECGHKELIDEEDWYAWLLKTNNTKI